LSLPKREEALAIMREAGCSRGVVEHCLRVTKIAMRIARIFVSKGFEVDMNLIEIGALMHDIGRSKTHSVEHGVIGGQLAREMGLPEPLARIIERHVGAGIPSDEATEIGLPMEDYVPETLEEKIVTYADKLVECDREVDIEVTVEKLAKELGRDHPALERLRALHIEIANIVGSDF
jgi:uncharacterized protein